MSWRATAYIKAMRICPNGEPITRSEKFVALLLAESHNDKGGHTYPSVNTIAGDAIMDERTCRRLLGSLESKCVIARERGEKQGRGELTFYRFPELDDEPRMPRSAPNTGRKKPPEGGQNIPLFFSERGAKGGQKGDKNGACIKQKELETGTKAKSPIIPLARKGETVCRDASNRTDGEAVAAAVERVMMACAWTKRALRRKLADVLAMQVDQGQAIDDTAAAIVKAWQYQIKHSHLLRHKFGAANFLELGIWTDPNKLAWDHERIDRAQRGSY